MPALCTQNLTPKNLLLTQTSLGNGGHDPVGRISNAASRNNSQGRNKEPGAQLKSEGTFTTQNTDSMMRWRDPSRLGLDYREHSLPTAKFGVHEVGVSNFGCFGQAGWIGREF